MPSKHDRSKYWLVCGLGRLILFSIMLEANSRRQNMRKSIAIYIWSEEKEDWAGETLYGRGLCTMLMIG
jgi:hypothetical protein